MKFRKKPIIVDAEQWFPPDYADYKPIDDVCSKYLSGVPGGYVAWIETLEGKLTVSPLDWIITGVKGEKYPCKPDIFAETYELIEE